jgi:DNA processing protein
MRTPEPHRAQRADERRSYHAAATALEGNYQMLRKLRGAYASWSAAWAALAARHPTLDPAVLWQELERSRSMLLLASDRDFPPLLREIPWPPFGIYVRGAADVLTRTPAIAVVGTRKATGEGRALAREFGELFAQRGIPVVSGLAFGIDAAAHEGALAGGGITIAVLAVGLDHVYPRSHTALAQRIVERGGALISEYPPGTPALPYRFLERNRIVSGLTAGTLVVEAPLRSGSLATARFALEQNRLVFAIPGPIRHPNHAGANRLIREGAELVTAADDILAALGIEPEQPAESAEPATEPERTVFRALAACGEPASIDKIAEDTHLEVRAVSQALSLLTLAGAVGETDAGYTIRKNRVG